MENGGIVGKKQNRETAETAEDQKSAETVARGVQRIDELPTLRA